MILLDSAILGMFGIKDIVDILLVATLLYYMYSTMRDSGTLNVFLGVMSFVVAWVVMYKILDMRLIGTIMDKFIDIGLFIIVILFQDQIRRFLTELGSRRGLGFLKRLWHRSDTDRRKKWVMPLVYACINMSKSKTGALIVVRRSVGLADYEHSGDMINADVNARLIENIFFKNSPLHDGALIIDNDKIVAAGCILPVSHDTDVPRYLGLRHRSALGIAQATDALAIVVSEETGGISYALNGELHQKLTSTTLEEVLSKFTQDL